MRLSRRDLSLLLLAAPFAAHADELDSSLNEEIIKIPAVIGGQTYQLVATLFRPNRTGRFPLMVINHGTDENPAANAQRRRNLSGAQVFVPRGFAVVSLMRRGYGGSEGLQFGHGIRNDLTGYGLENARDVQAAIVWLKTQAYVDPQRIVVTGQSTGGLTTMAYLSIADVGVLGGINFHGGMHPRNLISDPLLDARLDAFVSYAKTTKVPSIWFYTENDHSSRPAFISKLYAAYQQAGGHAELVQLGPFSTDGHFLFGRPEGVPIWKPHTDAFLSGLKL